MYKYYRIKNIVPKEGAMSNVHRSMVGQRCYIIMCTVGAPAYLKVETNPKMNEFHTICTTRVIYFVGENTKDVKIETDRTLYWLEGIEDSEESDV